MASLPSSQQKDSSNVTYEWRLSDILSQVPIESILLTSAIVFLFWVFFSSYMYRFYASLLFGIYHLTNSIWISVILLGVSQTLLLIPLRAMRVLHLGDISQFKHRVDQIESDEKQQSILKQSFFQGNRTFLFYVFDFVVQLTTFITIGRLFLTDFYQNKISPSILFSFIPYPEYPIKDKIFKIPYPRITQTIDYGLENALLVTGILIIIYLFFHALKYLIKTISQKESAQRSSQSINPITSGFYFVIVIFVWYLVRNFPTQVKFALFTGDVSIPNKTLNFITALASFGIIFWLGYNRIKQKGKKAAQSNIPSDVVDEIQQKMFNQLIKQAGLVGLGAYLITNQIPSAFELSIFSLEIITFFSPLTLDKLILKTAQVQTEVNPQEQIKPDSESDSKP